MAMRSNGTAPNGNVDGASKGFWGFWGFAEASPLMCKILLRIVYLGNVRGMPRARQSLCRDFLDKKRARRGARRRWIGPPATSPSRSKRRETAGRLAPQGLARSADGGKKRR